MPNYLLKTVATLFTVQFTPYSYMPAKFVDNPSLIVFENILAYNY